MTDLTLAEGSDAKFGKEVSSRRGCCPRFPSHSGPNFLPHSHRSDTTRRAAGFSAGAFHLNAAHVGYREDDTMQVLGFMLLFGS